MMQAIKGSTISPSSATKNKASFTGLPREIRDTIYSHIIDNSESSAYNDCGIGVAYPCVSILLLCKQIASEFTSALLRETRVALQINLDESSVLDCVNSARESVRMQACALAIDIREKSRPLFLEENGKDFDRQEVVDTLAHTVGAFPQVRDIAISVKLRNTANLELVGLLQGRLEQVPTLHEYRIYTHAFPSFQARLGSTDLWRGRSTVTWLQRVLYEQRRQWKARVIDNEQWSTKHLVWLVFGED